MYCNFSNVYTCVHANEQNARKDYLTMATRTAPTVDGSPSRTTLSMEFYDADEGSTTVSQPYDPASTNAELEAVAAAAQAISNASLFAIHIQQTYLGVGLASNADSDDYVSVKDVIRLSSRSADGNAYIRGYVPAPHGGLVYGNGSVLITDADYITWRTAFQAILPTGYALLNVGFVQNVARNKGGSPIA